MKKITITLILCCLLLSNMFALAQTPDANGIIYVKPSATGNGNGQSWANATANLHAAIQAIGVQQVFVAIGNYPTGSTSFVMRNGVAIYGGFDPANGISNLSHARILPNKGMGDGAVLNGENTRPVIWNVFASGSEMNATAILDGFTITGGKNADGGGFNNQYASPTLTNLVIRNNAATNDGGAMYNSYASPVLRQVKIINNTAGNNGGGMVNRYAYPILEYVWITGNTAGFLGGGITNGFGSSPTLNQVLIARNKAATNGGGIYNGSGGGVLNNVTMSDNVPTAISLLGSQISNSIIFGDVEATTIRNSLVEGNTNTANGNVYAAGFSPAAIFTDHANNDYTVRSVSPTINAGDNSLYPGLDANSKDFAGNPRVINTTIDMGIYESNLLPTGFGADPQGTIYVTAVATGNESGDSWANATSSLSRAIHAIGVQKVFVAIGIHKISGTGIVLKNNIPVYGGFDPANGISELSHQRIMPTMGGVAGTVLDGQQLSPVIRNRFTSGAPLNNTALLDGFTLTNGYNNVDGGAILNLYASPTFRNLVIKNSNASYGAAIFNRNASSPLLTNVVIGNNTAVNDGGAMYNDASCSPVLTNVAIVGNTAKNGAGIYNRTNSSPLLSNVRITGNSSSNSGNGVAIYNEASSSPILTNVTIAGNLQGNNAIYSSGGTTVLRNTLVFGGVAGSAISAQYALVQGNAGGTNGNLNGTAVTLTQVFANPSAADYGLFNASLALNAGSNALYTGLDANSKDLAGNARTYNGGTIDLGAYEYQGDPATLPVTLIGFTVRADGNSAKLAWQTAYETNNKRFVISRSGDDRQFVKIGEIPAGGLAQHYSFTDTQPLKGNNYYQLLQVDHDGTVSDLGVRTLNFSIAAPAIQFFPNPVHSEFTMVSPVVQRVQVIDLSGRIMAHLKLEVGTNVFNASLWPTGLYLLKTDTQQIKLIKK